MIVLPEGMEESMEERLERKDWTGDNQPEMKITAEFYPPPPKWNEHEFPDLDYYAKAYAIYPGDDYVYIPTESNQLYLYNRGTRETTIYPRAFYYGISAVCGTLNYLWVMENGSYRGGMYKDVFLNGEYRATVKSDYGVYNSVQGIGFTAWAIHKSGINPHPCKIEHDKEQFEEVPAANDELQEKFDNFFATDMSVVSLTEIWATGKRKEGDTWGWDVWKCDGTRWVGYWRKEPGTGNLSQISAIPGGTWWASSNMNLFVKGTGLSGVETVYSSTEPIILSICRNWFSTTDGKVYQNGKLRSIMPKMKTLARLAKNDDDMWGYCSAGASPDNKPHIYSFAQGEWTIPEAGEMHYQNWWKLVDSDTLPTDRHWNDADGSTSHLWACNEEGEVYSSDNGEIWALSYSNPGYNLTSIHAEDDYSVWVCGYNETNHLIAHWTPAYGWNAPGSFNEEGGALFWIWGGVRGDVWCVGAYGERRHWNGSNWAVERAANSELYGQHENIRIAGIGTSHIWTIGYGGKIAFYDGEDWYNESYEDWAFKEISVTDYFQVVIVGELNEQVILIQNTSPDVTWNRKTEWEAMLTNPQNGLWAWRDVNTFIHAFGNKVFDSSDIFGVQIQDVEENGTIKQFWRFTANEIYAVGYCEGHSGIWRQEPATKVTADLSKYLESGDLSLKDEAITSLSLTLSNPDRELIDEGWALMGLGTSLKLEFRIGSSPWLTMGTYWLDRQNFSVKEGNISITARNSIGKFLNDLPVPIEEMYHPAPFNVKTWIANILEDCGLTDYIIEDSGNAGFLFARNSTALQAIQDLMTVHPWWKMEEDYSGKIIIGSPAGTIGSFGSNFPPRGTYEFSRGETVISRAIEQDDVNMYSQVCAITAPASQQGVVIGQGDGDTTQFILPADNIVNGSDTIYLDKVPQRRNVDYYIDYETGVITFTAPPSGTRPDPKTLNAKKVRITLPDGVSVGKFEVHGSNDNFILDKQILLSDTSSWSGTGTFDLAATADFRYYSVEFFQATPKVKVTQICYQDADGGDLQPTMTANNAPYPNVVAGSSEEDGHPAWNAMDGDADTYWSVPGVGWHKLDCGTEESEGSVEITADFTASRVIYVDVPNSSSSHLPASKTYFVEIPAGTSEADTIACAREVANKIGAAGKLETFEAPFRPQLLPGDRASIDPGGELGTITEVSHRFGKTGFITSFTVDSGQSVSVPLILDIIKEAAKRREVPPANRSYKE